MAAGIEQRGSEEFELFLSAHRSALVRAAQKILKSSDEAEDVVQETATAAWRLNPSRTASEWKAYLFRAVYLNSLKRRARGKRTIRLGDNADSYPDDTETETGPEIDPFTLEEAVKGLPETQQTVIRMKYYAGLSFREIARAMSISANTVSSRCRYALNTLRRVLGRQGDKQQDK